MKVLLGKLNYKRTYTYNNEFHNSTRWLMYFLKLEDLKLLSNIGFNNLKTCLTLIFRQYQLTVEIV